MKTQRHFGEEKPARKATKKEKGDDEQPEFYGGFQMMLRFNILFG